MDWGEEVRDDEVIAAFVQAEFHSKRFGRLVRSAFEPHGRGGAVLESPDTKNDEANRIRRAVLAAYRGYGRNDDLFRGFPDDVVWWRARASAEDLMAVLYCNYSDWVLLSNRTRRVTDGAASVRAGSSSEDAAHIREIVKAIERGARMAPLILVAETKAGPFIALEGHKRLTAYALTLDSIREGVDVFIGLSENMPQWVFSGEPGDA